MSQNEELYKELLEISLSKEEAEAKAAELYRRGAVQTSRKYRTVVTFPQNESAFAAMKRLDPKAAERLLEDAKRYIQARARAEYALVYAMREGNQHELDVRTFECWRALNVKAKT